MTKRADRRSIRMARRAAVVLGAGLLLATGPGSASSGAPMRAVKDETVTGPGAVLPPTGFDANYYGTGFTGLSSSARIGRARANITVPGLPILAYVQPYSRQRGLGFSPTGYRTKVPATGALLPARPDPRCYYYYGGDLAELYATDVKQKINVTEPYKSPPGVFRSVGRFPDTHVSLLAFGSIPVTATLHLRQLVSRVGKVEPLIGENVSGRLSFSKSMTPQQGVSGNVTNCDQTWVDEAFPVIITGRLLASISDIKIDGRTVPVGDQCRTTSPLQINLVGEAGGFPGGTLSSSGIESGGIIYQRLDRRTVNPSNPLPLFPDSSNLTVPPFSGCMGPTGDDVSRLITAIASGPSNTLAVNFTYPVLGAPIDRNHPNICDLNPPPGANFGCATGAPSINPPTPGK